MVMGLKPGSPSLVGAEVRKGGSAVAGNRTVIIAFILW